ncbi:MAG TPA: CocE/NonD family hydrolase, partial [bacterium]
MIRVRNTLIALAVIGLLSGLMAVDRRRSNREAVSEFGRYRGYTRQAYDGSRRISHYLTLANGTRLAYDLYLPTKDGILADTPLPVLFKYTPYGRTWTIFDKDGTNNLTRLTPLPWYLHPLLRLRARFAKDGNLLDHLWRTKWLSAMVKSGYAVVVVERPGTGASFGRLDFTPHTSARETDEILNWIAAQNWSDGKIGMFGDSIQAQIQLQAASTANPHLKAILPATTWMDSYGALMFPGGVRNTAFIEFYVRANRAFDFLSTPVDEDRDGALLAEARAERRGAGLADYVENTPTDAFRDDVTAQGRNYWEEYMSLYPLMARINRSGVPVYLINGWYDICTRDDFLIYANLTTPKRLLVRPVDHSQIEAPGRDIDYGAEAHRWFDYWLKGLENGVMDEHPVHYFLQGAGVSDAWQSADGWPPKNVEGVRYYFGPGRNGGTASVNDGTLVPSLPAVSDGLDAYTVDYRTTSGSRPRWSAPASPHRYPNMRVND